jgi:hypothetical protein
MTPNDKRRAPFPPAWRLKAFLREWRDALIWVPFVLALIVLLYAGIRKGGVGPVQNAAATVLFVRPAPGAATGDPPLVGLDINGVTYLARPRLQVTPGQHVRAVMRLGIGSRRPQSEVMDVKPLPSG